MPNRIMIETCPAPECNLTTQSVETFMDELTAYNRLFEGAFV